MQLGALGPLIAMAEAETQSKQYAGFALLKLADNFENHVRIAEEGGIEALLRLGRSCNTHQELQYKASRAVMLLLLYLTLYLTYIIIFNSSCPYNLIVGLSNTMIGGKYSQSSSRIGKKKLHHTTSS